MKIRVPRTTQEIEANYRRKKLAEKFKERLMLIQNQDMDDVDLKRGNYIQIVQKYGIFNIVLYYLYFIFQCKQNNLYSHIIQKNFFIS